MVVQRRDYRNQRRPHSLFISSTNPPPLPSIKPPPLPKTLVDMAPSTTTDTRHQRIDDSIIYIDSIEQVEQEPNHDYHLIDELIGSNEVKTIRKCASNNSFDSSFEYIQATSSPDKDSLCYDSGCDTNTSTINQQTTQLLIEKLLNKCNINMMSTSTTPTTQLLLKKSSNSSMGDYIEKVIKEFLKLFESLWLLKIYYNRWKVFRCAPVKQHDNGGNNE